MTVKIPKWVRQLGDPMITRSYVNREKPRRVSRKPKYLKKNIVRKHNYLVFDKLHEFK